MAKRKPEDLEVGEPLVCCTKNETHKTGNLYQKALNALLNNDLTTFASNINTKVINYNNSNLLHLAASDKKYSVTFLWKMLEQKPNLNVPVEQDDRRTAIQIAFHAKHYEAFWILFDAGADLNYQDRLGYTVLHYIAQESVSNPAKYYDHFKTLLESREIYVNIPDRRGETPIAALSQYDYFDFNVLRNVKLFLDLAPDIDLDTYCDSDGKSARDHLLQWYPQNQALPGKWLPRGGILDYRYRLFYYLTSNDDSKRTKEQLFIHTWREALQDKAVDINDLLECTSREMMTYLQEAIIRAKMKIVYLLVQSGVDVNFTPLKTKRPIFLAVEGQNTECMEYFLRIAKVNGSPDENGNTLIHTWIRSCDSVINDVCLFDQKLPVLLDKFKIDINAKNNDGETALHLAVQFGNEKHIFTLLDHGAHLDVVSTRGITPLSQLNPVSFKKYLDSKIEKISGSTISMHYPFLRGKDRRHVHDKTTELLRILRNSEPHLQQIAHPVIAFMINAKWMRIHVLFYMYLILAICFSISATSFIYLAPQVTCGVNCGISYLPPVSETFITTGKSGLLIYLAIRFCFECFDCFCSPSQYFRLYENYLQLAMVFLSIICLSFDCPSNPEGWPFCPAILAFAVLFVWLDLFFVIGKHPKINFFIDIFRTATSFLLQFITVHATLIVAFVFSFYVLFRKETGPFDSVPQALFKTIVMITGEFEVDAIPLNSSPIVSHTLFILFMFLVSIVLFNLLIGLAVSATGPIENDPFLYSNMAQIPIIIFIEKIFFNNDVIYKLIYGTTDKLVRYREPEIDMVYANLGRININFRMNNEREARALHVWQSTNSRLINDAEKVCAKAKARETKTIKENEIGNLNAEMQSVREELKNLVVALRAIEKKVDALSSSS